MKLGLGVGVLVALAAAPVAAQEVPSELDLFELDEEVRTSVVTTTKTKQELREAPSVVSVITADEIRARGYRSIADVVRATAGFHVIDDHVTVDAGVRGVHGGVRGASRLVKVMIDGQPMDFRTTTGYFLGPELIPIELVERVEIIRGPASALYGADAFLGVINVITRKGADLPTVGVAYRGGFMDEEMPRWGVSVWGGKQEGNLEIVAGTNLDRNVRSGLLLPESSPDFQAYCAPDDAGQCTQDIDSERDVALPRGFYGRLRLDTESWGSFALIGSFQHLDAREEFVDTSVTDVSALSHGTRVDLVTRSYRLAWEKSFGDDHTVRVAGNYAIGQPGSHDVIDPRTPLLVYRRDFSYHAGDLEAEWVYQPRRELAVVVGSDLSTEIFELELVHAQYTEATGPFSPGDLRASNFPRPDDEVLSNFGTYGQLIYYPIKSLGLTGGLRVDVHTLYGVVPSGRLGAVYLFEGGLYLKALMGSSFKAPSPDNLYGQPLYTGALAGAADLDKQTATTAEIVAGYDAGRGLAASASIYGLRVKDKVEFVPQGRSLRAANLSTIATLGAELELSWREKEIAERFDVALFGNGSFILATDKDTETAAATVAPDESFPSWVANAGVTVTAPAWHVGTHVELSAIGSRSATGSNRFRTPGLVGYDLDPYGLLSIYVTSVDLTPFGERVTRFSLRATNVLDSETVEPGTGGIDIPGLGRTVMFEVQQHL